jgi:hypothetical protein
MDGLFGYFMHIEGIEEKYQNEFYIIVLQVIPITGNISQI